MITKVTLNHKIDTHALLKSLWPDITDEELSKLFQTLITCSNHTAYLYYMNNKAVGYAQTSLRHDYVEGTKTSPVGYLEGIYVEPCYRRHKIAQVLLAQCEQWALQKGCTEFASDCAFENIESAFFHTNSGFKEAARIICYVKPLTK
ncbi:aminoglycoside 6'-N-acetyltransferase [Marinilactibacillus sp. GCM10026970]|uniref:aminoglycoside 6'-N-acetyltransferase n=1 Tax=Marinilactibacillus sp. GCM10026970 TaxID=3252642 RepID=UPI00361E18F2